MSQQTLVALDIETTGLDSQKDAIIEIGAIRFRGTRIEGEYHTLLNPGRSIPRNVVDLTGITDAMVARAPRAVDKLPELEEFVGDDPVVGHQLRPPRCLAPRPGPETVPFDAHDVGQIQQAATGDDHRRPLHVVTSTDLVCCGTVASGRRR